MQVTEHRARLPRGRVVSSEMSKTRLAVDPAPCSGCAAGAGAGPDGRGAVRQHVILRSRFLARSLSTWCSLVEFLSQDRIFVTDIRRVTNAPRICFFNTVTLRVRPRASLSPAARPPLAQARTACRSPASHKMAPRLR